MNSPSVRREVQKEIKEIPLKDLKSDSCIRLEPRATGSANSISTDLIPISGKANPIKLTENNQAAVP